MSHELILLSQDIIFKNKHNNVIPTFLSSSFTEMSWIALCLRCRLALFIAVMVISFFSLCNRLGAVVWDDDNEITEFVMEVVCLTDLPDTVFARVSSASFSDWVIPGSGNECKSKLTTTFMSNQERYQKTISSLGRKTKWRLYNWELGDFKRSHG